jgi:hypothetical protein
MGSAERQPRRSRNALDDPRTIFHSEYADWVLSWDQVLEFQNRGRIGSLGWGRVVDEISLTQAILLDLIRQYAAMLSIDQMSESVKIVCAAHHWPHRKLTLKEIRDSLELLDMAELIEPIPTSRRTRYRLTEQGWLTLAPANNPTSRKLRERGLHIFRMTKPSSGDEGDY